MCNLYQKMLVVIVHLDLKNLIAATLSRCHGVCVCVCVHARAHV